MHPLFARVELNGDDLMLVDLTTTVKHERGGMAEVARRWSAISQWITNEDDEGSPPDD